MLDPQLLRKDLESVKTRLANRGFELDTGLFTQLENERKQLQSRTEELQGKRNQLAKAIGMKKGKGENADVELAESSAVNQELEKNSARLTVLQEEIKNFLLNIPMSVYLWVKMRMRIRKSSLGASLRNLISHPRIMLI
jgi:seryl-tRNA synthetase